MQISNWKSAGLEIASLARMSKLTTVDKMFVKRKLGELQTENMTNIKKALAKLWP
ncbi:MAG: type II toxin-antitoxin system PemK/MazF family toxin [Trueperaceae bacterium]